MHFRFPAEKCSDFVDFRRFAVLAEKSSELRVDFRCEEVVGNFSQLFFVILKKIFAINHISAEVGFSENVTATNLRFLPVC